MAERPVELYVYDISQGLARQFSLQMLGIQIDAVYHTSIVLGGTEYYFGHGLQTSTPGATHHGRPMEVVKLGPTSLPDDVVREYIDSLKTEYSPESYDLFLHNCNNFTADLAMFLCGRSIPDHIKNLPQTVLETPFGQMLRPALERQLRPITTAHSGPTFIPPSGRVHVATSLPEFDRLLASAQDKCAAVFFTSSGCPPCGMVYPHFESLAAESGAKSVFIKVDVGRARDIGMKYSISATPTFITYSRGAQADKWSGASPADLKTNIAMLLAMTYPSHPHTQIAMPITLATPMHPVTFSKSPPLDKLATKLGSLADLPPVAAHLSFLRSLTTAGPANAPIPDLAAWANFITEYYTTLDPAVLFPLTDLFRTSLSDPRVSGYFAEHTEAVETILTYTTTHDPPYALLLTTVQLACNLFTTPLLPPRILPQLVPVITHALLSQTHATLRVAASSAAFNIGVAVQRGRQKREEVVGVEVLVELVAALVEAVGREEGSKEVVRAGVLALAGVVYKGEVGGEVEDVAKALEAGRVVREKAGGMGEAGLGAEVGWLLDA